MLDVLGFRINTPTAHTFLSMFKQVGGLSRWWGKCPWSMGGTHTNAHDCLSAHAASVWVN